MPLLKDKSSNAINVTNLDSKMTETIITNTTHTLTKWSKKEVKHEEKKCLIEGHDHAVFSEHQDRSPTISEIIRKVNTLPQDKED